MVQLELVTLAGTKFSEEVHEVLLPTPQGQIGVFQHHMPLVSLAVPGLVAIRRRPQDPDDFLEYFAINGGVIEILDNKIRLLVDEADHSDEVNEAEAREAMQRATELRRQAKDQVELDKAQSLIDRQVVRLKVAELKRHRKRRY